METDYALAGSIAGAIAVGLQWAGIQIGWIGPWKRVIALGLAVIAGAVVSVAGTEGGLNVDNFLTAAIAALGTSQIIFAMVLTKLPSSTP